MGTKASQTHCSARKPPTVEARLLRLSARTDPAYASRSTRISRLDEFDAFFPSSQGGFFGENVFAKGEYLDKGYVERAEEGTYWAFPKPRECLTIQY